MAKKEKELKAGDVTVPDNSTITVPSPFNKEPVRSFFSIYTDEKGKNVVQIAKLNSKGQCLSVETVSTEDDKREAITAFNLQTRRHVVKYVENELE